MSPMWMSPRMKVNLDGRPRLHLRDQLLSLADLRDLPPVGPLIEGLLYRDTLAQLRRATRLL